MSVGNHIKNALKTSLATLIQKSTRYKVQVLPTVPTRKVRFCSTEVERTVTGLKIMDALNYKHESILWDTFFSY